MTALGKFISRVYPALLNLPDKLTRQQALRALQNVKGGVSKDEVYHTLPSLRNLTPETANLPTTGLDLIKEYGDNPLSLTAKRRGVKGNQPQISLNDEWHELTTSSYQVPRGGPTNLPRIIDDGKYILFENRRMDGSITNINLEANSGLSLNVQSLLPIETKEERRELVDYLVAGIDEGDQTLYDSREMWGISIAEVKVDLEKFIDSAIIPKSMNKMIKKSAYIGELDYFESLGFRTVSSSGQILKEFSTAKSVSSRSRLARVYQGIGQPVPGGTSTNLLNLHLDFGRANLERELTDFAGDLNINLAPAGGSESTTYGNYTLPGARANYTETPTVLDTPQKFKRGYTPNKGVHHTDAQGNTTQIWPDPEGLTSQNFREGHLPDDNILFHTRQSTRPLYPDNTPVSMMEEAQSEWSRKARKQGVLPNSPPPPRTYKPEDLSLVDSFPADPDRGFLEKAWLLEDPDYNGRGLRSIRVYANTEDEAREIAVNFFIDDQRRELSRGSSAVPPAPYLKNWEKLALQQALAEAVQQGSPGLAYPMGRHFGNDVYPFMNTESKEGLRRFYDNKFTAVANKALRPYGTQVETRRINVNAGDRVNMGLNNMFSSNSVVEADEFSNLPRAGKEATPIGFEQTEGGRYRLTGPSLDPFAEPVSQGTFRERETAERHAEMLRKRARRAEAESVVRDTRRVRYIPFTEELIEAIKKGIPLSILTGMGLQGMDDE